MTDEECKKRISANLRRLSAERGWSINEVARQASSFPSTIKELGDGKRMPGVGLLTRIADAFGVHIDAFLTEPKKNQKSA